MNRLNRMRRRLRHYLKQRGNKGLWVTSAREKWLQDMVDAGHIGWRTTNPENPRARVHLFNHLDGKQWVTFSGNVTEFSRFLREQELTRRKQFPAGTLRVIAAGVRGNLRRLRKIASKRLKK